MGRVSLESSHKLSELSRAIGELNSAMQENLKLLNNAFSTACESWQDKNAQTCRNALSGHNAAMRLDFCQLKNLEDSISRLSKLVLEYEDK